MARKEEILFGKIAVKKGFITKEELKKALSYQDQADKEIPIGAVMVRANLLNQDQLDEVLKIQEKNLEKKDDLTDSKKKDILFGKLVLKKGYMEWQNLNEMIKKLNELRSRGRYMRLGELLIKEGYLTPEQVHEILKEQNKQVMRCMDCETKYNVAMPPRGNEKLTCPKCDGHLQKIESEEEPDVDTDIAMKGDLPDVQKEAKKAEINPEDTTLISRDQLKKEAEMKESEGKYLFSCVICNHEFRASPDRFGRVECPNCTTMFSAAEGILED